ncbi:hypothetical protein B0J14DRAFT_256286 [Halenospora varia]|nr:hypothetical protein B0J14DRAFT_256286 [Halenospora varia]
MERGFASATKCKFRRSSWHVILVLLLAFPNRVSELQRFPITSATWVFSLFRLTGLACSFRTRTRVGRYKRCNRNFAKFTCETQPHLQSQPYFGERNLQRHLHSTGDTETRARLRQHQQKDGPFFLCKNNWKGAGKCPPFILSPPFSQTLYLTSARKRSPLQAITKKKRRDDDIMNLLPQHFVNMPNLSQESHVSLPLSGSSSVASRHAGYLENLGLARSWDDFVCV